MALAEGTVRGFDRGMLDHDVSRMLDLEGDGVPAHLAARLEALSRRVAAIAAVVAECAALDWQASAAQVYEQRVLERSARLRALATDLEELAAQVRLLGTVAGERAREIRAAALAALELVR